MSSSRKWISLKTTAFQTWEHSFFKSSCETTFFLLAAAWVCSGRSALQSAKHRCYGRNGQVAAGQSNTKESSHIHLTCKRWHSRIGVSTASKSYSSSTQHQKRARRLFSSFLSFFLASLSLFFFSSAQVLSCQTMTATIFFC